MPAATGPKRAARRAGARLDALRHAWIFPKDVFTRFSQSRAAGRGAAIAFYAVTAVIPVLIVVISVAGLVIGRDAASAAVFAQFDSLLGNAGTEIFRRAVIEASRPAVSVIASLVSIATLLITTSGVFLELEEALNWIWETKAQEDLAALARARVISFGLVIALGFLLLISLVIDAAIAGASGWVNGYFPFGKAVLLGISQLISFVLLTEIFAGIMKFLPNIRVSWRNVGLGAAFTALLFILGKLAIGLYLVKSTAVTALGDAGAFLALLLWVYYSAQIFLFGAVCTRVVADRRRAGR